MESGDVAVNEEDIPAGFAEKKLDRYIETHKIRGYGKVDGCVKRVACDERTKEYIQLQAVKLDDDTYMVQEFDNELVFMGELWSGCKYPDEVLDWMKSNYEIESCLTAEVYRSSLGDCTNNGISSYARELYILDAQKGPFEPDDIRQCVYIEKREIMGQEYVDCKPAYSTGKGEKTKAFYKVLELYGFQYPNDEEKGVVEGTSDLYVKKEGAK